METILSEILTRLKAQVPELRYIAIDEGQLDNPDENGNYPILTPGCTIDIDNVNWTTTVDPEQSGEGTVVIRFAWMSPARLDNNTSSTSIAAGLERWNLHHTICQALHGYSGTNFGRLERITTTREKREGLLKVMIITFAFEGAEDLTLPAT